MLALQMENENFWINTAINNDLWVVAPHSFGGVAGSMLFQKAGANTRG
jgi:hypothetical protein